MTEAAIRFDGLGHYYRDGRWIFRNYTATVARGHVFAILGPNGRGKTTLLKLVLGALKPREGSVATAGRVAFVPQLFDVSFAFTVLDMVTMGRAKRIGLFSMPSAHDEDAAYAALERLGIAALADESFQELSGGQRQLVILARALVAEADILILDEPTSALDLKNQAMFLGWIARLAREDGMTILFTTHHPHHALAVADDALLMLGENEYACGRAADVLTEDNLKALYDVPIKRLTFESEGQEVASFVPIFTVAKR